MNNGANLESYISGFSVDLIEISQIWTKMTGSDKSLTEGGDLDRSRVELQHPLWGIAPSLSPPHVGSSGWVLVDASVNRLRCQSDQLADWQLHSVRLRSGLVRHRSGIDGLSFSYNGLSPWDLCPPWDGSPIFCINKAQAASSKLVRVGLRSCFHCNTAIFLMWIKNIWRLYCVVHVFVWIPSVMLLMW